MIQAASILSRWGVRKGRNNGVPRVEQWQHVTWAVSSCSSLLSFSPNEQRSIYAVVTAVTNLQTTTVIGSKHHRFVLVEAGGRFRGSPWLAEALAEVECCCNTEGGVRRFLLVFFESRPFGIRETRIQHR